MANGSTISVAHTRRPGRSVRSTTQAHATPITAHAAVTSGGQGGGVDEERGGQLAQQQPDHLRAANLGRLADQEDDGQQQRARHEQAGAGHDARNVVAAGASPAKQADVA